METAIIILVSINIILGVAVMAVLLMKMKKKGENADVGKTVEAESARIRETVETVNRTTSDVLLRGVSATNTAVLDNVKNISETNATRITELKEEVQRSLSEVRQNLFSTLKEVREDNSKQLEAMRGVVDEKLTKTLNDSLSASFTQVSERLEQVYKSLGEMQTLTGNVNDLKKILSGVKQRGGWGEVSLENILSDVLSPSQYEAQSSMNGSGRERVDFAVIMPGFGDGKVYLPIDSKFPVEDYLKMNDALVSGNTEEYKTYRSALAARVKSQATEIKNKYIDVPRTTDFAIMFLPTESLYAEVLRIAGLQEKIQNEQRVVIAGPTTITALLNSLRMGFKTVQIQKNTAEIIKLFKDFKKDFDKFTTFINSCEEQMSKVQGTLAQASDRTRIIQRKLLKIESIEGATDEDVPRLIE